MTGVLKLVRHVATKQGQPVKITQITAIFSNRISRYQQGKIGS